MRPPATLREEWASEHALPHFLSTAFSDSVDRVWRRMGVHEGDTVEHNGPNRILLRGCKRLGLPVATAPQNAAGAHDCGWCGLGCRYGHKQGTHVSFFADALTQGAKFIPRCAVTAVTMRAPDRGTGTSADGRPVVTGVTAAVTDASGAVVALRVRAPVVVVACGALQSPLLLRRSGLTNPHIGQVRAPGSVLVTLLVLVAVFASTCLVASLAPVDSAQRTSFLPYVSD